MKPLAIVIFTFYTIGFLTAQTKQDFREAKKPMPYDLKGLLPDYNSCLENSNR